MDEQHRAADHASMPDHDHDDRGDLDHLHHDDHGHPQDEHDYAHDEQGHRHDEPHGHDHDHEHEPGGLLGHLPFFHQHSHGETNVDTALEGSAEGLRTLALSLLLLGATAAVQLAIALLSGSVGLLADTIHNAGDALTALPLGLAFVVGRRPPNRRYTYGYGRAEDVAGVLIVLIIFASAAVAAVESIMRLLHPQSLGHLPWVMAAAVVGFTGNEAVAELRIRTGRRIGSAALEADGQHARVDGFTSLAVLLGAAGAALGWRLADPIVGLLITVVILVIVHDSALTMWHRLMDAVDEPLIARIERVAAGVPGVLEISQVRARYIGHRIFADLRIGVDGAISTEAGHAIAEEAHHRLLHDVPRLAEAQIHVDPAGQVGAHDLTSHHAP